MKAPKPGSRAAEVMAILDSVTATNAFLADALYTHCGDIARLMNKLMKRGLVVRVDGGSGRGSRAIYAKAVQS